LDFDFSVFSEEISKDFKRIEKISLKKPEYH